MNINNVLVSVITAAWFTAAPAHAQAPASQGPVVLGALGGMSVSAGRGGGAVGATLSLDVGSRTSLEGRGVMFGAGHGSEGFELSASLLIDLVTVGTATPYLALGGGLYRTHFNLDDPWLLGRMADQYPVGTWIAPQGTGFGMMGGGGPTVGGHMGSYYANRFGPMQVPASGMWGMRGFTDPAVSIGGGVWLDVTSHLSVRPDFRALVAIRDGNATTVGTFSLGLGYRF